MLLTPRITRWALAIQEFDFSINFVRGTENVIADVLSPFPVTRPPTPTDRCFNLFALFDLPKDFRQTLENCSKLQLADPFLNSIMNKLKSGNPELSNKFVIHNAMLFVRRPMVENFALCIPSALIQ